MVEEDDEDDEEPVVYTHTPHTCPHAHPVPLFVCDVPTLFVPSSGLFLLKKKTMKNTFFSLTYLILNDDNELKPQL